MKKIFVTLVFLPQLLFGQKVVDAMNNASATFSEPHINKWMVIQKYMDRNDTLFFTEALSKKNKYESWEDMSFVVSNTKDILIADMNEETVFILPNNHIKKNRKINSIELDDSLSFLFEDVLSDTIFKTDSGYGIHGKNKLVTIKIDSIQNLLVKFEIRGSEQVNTDETDVLLSTEWTLISHSTEPASARDLTLWENYAKTNNGKLILIGKLNKYELVDLINE